ncbi:MAG: hypothetical protein ACYC7D_03545 [Nitrososphaerales archaeon]
MQRAVNPLDQKEEIRKAISVIRAKSADFDFACETYTQQYGQEKISLDSEATSLSDTVDPLSIILGRNCVISYSDSKMTLKGNLGSIQLKPGACYIVGRRQPQDQKLVCWGPGSTTELEEYNSRVSIIPSRVHGAFICSENDTVDYLDLGSSSGTILVGESLASGPFVKVYDPGAMRPSIRFDRITTARK